MSFQFVRVVIVTLCLVITVVSAPKADVDMSFMPGANLTAFPTGYYSSVSDVLNLLNQVGHVTSIQKLNHSTGLYDTSAWHKENPVGAVYAIEPYEGYIVNAEDGFTTQIPGSYVCTAVPLQIGTNLIAIPCPPENYSSYNFLQDTDSDEVTIKSYESISQEILSAEKAGDTISGDSFPIEQGKAYFVETESDSIWYPSPEPDFPLDISGVGGDGFAYLKWQQDDSDFIQGYNIYYSETSNGEFIKINVDPLIVPYFAHPLIPPGATNYYKITSVDIFGRESLASPEIPVIATSTGPTVITANIDADTTWSPTGSPYIIAQNIQVAVGATLTILPGTEILVENAHLEVLGTLLADGTEELPITFSSNMIEPAFGDWAGIRLIGPENDSSSISYVNLEHFTTALYIENSTPEISYCNISWPSGPTGAGNGIAVISANPHIHHCRISAQNSIGYGIFIRNGSPLIEHNEIIGANIGIAVEETGNPRILNNRITEFYQRGIDLYGNSNYEASPFPIINYNAIHSSTQTAYNLYTRTYGTGPSLAIDARFNYWGTTQADEVVAYVYQWPRNSTSPLVDLRKFTDIVGQDNFTGTYIPAGRLPDDLLNWSTANGPYLVLGSAWVESDQNLVISEGVEIQIAGRRLENYMGSYDSFYVQGTLTVEGTVEQPVIFTSYSSSPVGWEGLVFTGSGSNNSSLSHADIQRANTAIWCQSASPTISSSSIHLLYTTESTGVRYGAFRLTEGSAPLIDGNQLTADVGVYGIFIKSSSPTITNNYFSGFGNGIYLDSDPNDLGWVRSEVSITHNTFQNISIIANIYGTRSASTNPLITMNYNSITPKVGTSTIFSCRRFNFSGTNTVVDATNNWWGTANPAEIADMISDNEGGAYPDNPIVDFRWFLTSDGGTPSGGNQFLVGTLPEGTTTWTAENSPYMAMGGMTVPANSTLRIEPGTTVMISGDQYLAIDGTLDAQGTAENPITFTTSNPTPVFGDWMGIQLNGNMSVNSVLKHVRIEYASTGIAITDISPEISHVTITGRVSSDDPNGTGIDLVNSNAWIHDCTITSDSISSGTYNAINVLNSSPIIEDNHIAGGYYGIVLADSGSAQITNNVIENYYSAGIYITYSTCTVPQPVITDNSIYSLHGYLPYGIRSNGNAACTYDNSTVINARRNYWGSVSLYDVLARVEQTSGPLIDFGDFLDGHGGTPVPGNFIFPGNIPDDMLNWSPANSPYIVIGRAYVGDGKNLQIEPGTEVRFIGGTVEVGNNSVGVSSSLHVDGRLTASGSGLLPIIFTSDNETPSAGNWGGFVFNSTAASDSILSHSKISYADTAIQVTGSSLSLENLSISDISGHGILIRGESNSTVHNNHISGNGNYQGITAIDSSPSIVGNYVQNFKYGIYVLTQADATAPVNPELRFNTLISNSTHIALHGTNSDAALNPQPTITDNNIITSSYYNVYCTYTAGPATVTATNNWWGTDDMTTIANYMYDGNDNTSSPILELDPIRTAAARSEITTMSVSTDHFSPDGDGSYETFILNWETLSDSVWVVSVYDASGQLVRETSGSGSQNSWIWDGLDGNGQPVGDGLYTIKVTGTDIIAGHAEVTIDTKAPEFQLISPVHGETYHNDIEISGNLSEESFQSLTIQIGRGNAPTEWHVLDTVSEPPSVAGLYTFVTNDNNGDYLTITGLGQLTNGEYSLRVTTTDTVGHSNTETVAFFIDNLQITGVSRENSLLDPELSQTSSVSFTTNYQSDVTFQVFSEYGGTTNTLYYEETRTLPAGQHSFTWNARDNQGNQVADDAYLFILSANDGLRSDRNQPSPILGGGLTNMSGPYVPGSFNTYANDPFTLLVRNWVAGRVIVRIQQACEPFYLVNLKPYDTDETFLVTWDGICPETGEFISPGLNADIYFTALYQAFPPNYIIVRSSELINTEEENLLLLKADPYLITHSYDQFSTMSYSLGMDAQVSLYLLPPGETDPLSDRAVAILEDQSQDAGDHFIHWYGLVGDSENTFGIEDEGIYTVLLKAINDSRSQTQKAILNIYR